MGSEICIRDRVKEAADASFNCITIDGDTSTNDSFVMIASGQSGAFFASEADAGWSEVKGAIVAVAAELAQAIVRDGEGAPKFLTGAAAVGEQPGARTRPAGVGPAARRPTRPARPVVPGGHPGTRARHQPN